MPILPGTRELNTNIKGDIYGGITAAVVALPLALAFGVSSGAGPIAGLYGAICVGFFAAILGGTPAQISGPTGPMTVVMAGVFTHYTSLDPTTGPAIAFTVVIMGGAMQIIFGLLKIGRFITLVPAPVVSGFMSGIGVIIILLQIGPLLGHEPSASPLNAFYNLGYLVTHPIFAPTMLGLVGLVIVFLMPKNWNKVIPSPLLALVVGTVIYLFLMQHESVRILGDIPNGLPDIQMPTISWPLFTSMLVSAATLALLGSIDSLLTSLVADNITRTHHNSNKELIGQGVGNMVAGFLGGLPGAGATMRTVINVRAGGQTPLSGMLHALILLAIVLGASGFAKDIPHAVLAAILIKVGVDIIDWEYMFHVKHAPKTGVLMMIIVLLVTVFIDLITAVALGMVMASFVFMKRMADMQIKSANIAKHATEDERLSIDEAKLLNSGNGNIALYHLTGPLGFPAAKDMVKLVSKVDDYQVLVLDLTDVTSVDYTSCRAIDDIIQNALEDKKHVLLSGASDFVFETLKKQKALVHIIGDNVIANRLTALEVANQYIAK